MRKYHDSAGAMLPLNLVSSESSKMAAIGARSVTHAGATPGTQTQ